MSEFQNQDPENSQKEQKLARNTARITVLSISGTLLVLLLIIGVFWLGKSSSANQSFSNSLPSLSTGSKSLSITSSPLSSSVSSSMSSSVVSSSSISSSSMSSSIASSSVSNLKTFSGEPLSNLSFQYDPSWSNPVGFGENRASYVNLKKNGSVFTILATQIVDSSDNRQQEVCLDSTQILDIGNGWSRLKYSLRGTLGRYFVKTSDLQYTNRTIVASGGGTSTCGTNTVATVSTDAGLLATVGSSRYYVRISLIDEKSGSGITDTQRDIADEIVKSIALK